MPKLENFLTFLNKDLQFKEGLREFFCGNSRKISHCQVWSILKTLPGCRVSRHINQAKHLSFTLTGNVLT